MCSVLHGLVRAYDVRYGQPRESCSGSQGLKDPWLCIHMCHTCGLTTRPSSHVRPACTSAADCCILQEGRVGKERDSAAMYPNRAMAGTRMRPGPQMGPLHHSGCNRSHYVDYVHTHMHLHISALAGGPCGKEARQSCHEPHQAHRRRKAALRASDGLPASPLAAIDVIL